MVRSLYDKIKSDKGLDNFVQCLIGNHVETGDFESRGIMLMTSIDRGGLLF